MRGILFALIILCCALFSANAQKILKLTPETNAQQSSQKRIALVIANSTYQNVESLRSKNPSNDAADIAEALRLLGFKVYFGVDQNFREIESLINDFGTELAQTKGIGLFYYTGHGFHVEAENFLVPVDTRVKQEADSTREGVSLDLLLSKLKAAKNAANFVFLDLVSESQFVQGWRTEQEGFVALGFTKITPPKNTTLFYTSQPNDLAALRFGRNGFFAASFLKQIDKPNLDFEQFASALTDDLAERTFNQQKPLITGNPPKNFYFVDEFHKPPVIETKSLEEYFGSFKAQIKAPCGQRDEARLTAKEIIENYGNDELNHELIAAVKKRLQQIEKEDKLCDRNNRYENSYKAKNWRKFFEFSREIVNEEGDTPLVIDVLVTVVIVGFNRVKIDQIDDFNSDTVFFAKKMIELLGKGIKSNKYPMGYFDSFGRYSNVVDWCNYIIGYITYFRFEQRTEGAAYLYKSFKNSAEFKEDWTVYQTIGNYYFDITMSLYETYKEKKKANIYKDNSETIAILTLALGYADRAIDAYGRARTFYKNFEKGHTNEELVFNENLNEVYIFRFNFVPKMPTWGMDDHIKSLNKRPLPDPTTKVEPIPL